VENRIVRRIALTLACLLVSGGIARAAANNAPASQPSQPADTPATSTSIARTYDLRFRPVVGLRWATQSLQDTDVRMRSTGPVDTDAGGESANRIRVSVVVVNEEITELRGEQVSGRRVTFGKDCWMAVKQGDKKAIKKPLFYAGTTIDFRFAPDGTMQMIGLSDCSPEERRRLGSMMSGSATLFAGRPVAIGEQWRADEGLRAMAGLNSTDDVSATFMLQGVRQLDGREVADIAVAGRIVSRQQSARLAVSMRGTMVVDAATGVTLKADLVGRGQLEGGTRGGAKAKSFNMTGTAKASAHAIARLLAAPGTGPLTAAQSPATQPAQTQASADDEPPQTD
jgi:hypothetical protein